MKVARYLNKRLIFLDLPHNSKNGAIEFLTQAVCDYYRLPYKDEILCDVFKREEIKSTGLGKGLSIPHARTELIDRIYVVFARSDKGIDWTSVDGEPVHYIFYIIGPSKLEKEYLEILGDISRIMIRNDIREGIRVAKRPEEVIQIIKKSGVRRKRRCVE